MTELGQLTNNSSYDDVAQAIILEAKRRGYTLEEAIAVVSALIQESGLKPTIWGPAGKRITYGIAQQDGSYPNRMDPNAQVSEFFNRLDIKRNSPAHGDIWANIFWLQQGPNWPSAQYGLDNGRKAYMTEIKSHITEANRLVNLYWDGGKPVADNRPDFNEFPVFLTGNSHARDINKIDLWLLHTQEPPVGSDNRNDAALELRNFLESTKGGANPVSYHYTGSMANDGGTTVVDCVDTDDACWAVGNSNDRSINFCFAGTRADWTRDQWINNELGSILAAAYLFVQDCKKYPKLQPRVIAPNYSAPPGAADHNYCTTYLKDGNDHHDVGPNFPWDLFTAAVNKFASDKPADPVTPARQFPKDYTDRELLEWIVNQLGDGDPSWPSKGMTVRDKLWSVATKVGA